MIHTSDARMRLPNARHRGRLVRLLGPARSLGDEIDLGGAGVEAREGSTLGSGVPESFRSAEGVAWFGQTRAVRQSRWLGCRNSPC